MTTDTKSNVWAPIRGQAREAILIPADGGETEYLEGFGAFRTRIARYEDTEAWFSIVDVDLAKGQNILPQASVNNERVAICHSGTGRVSVDGREHDVAQGAMMFWGRGTSIALAQTGDELFRLSIISLVPNAEEASSLFPINRSGIETARTGQASESADGFLIEQEAEGEQYWQAAPSLGFITLKFGEDLPVSYFSASSQTLDADAFVRLHGHARSTEIVVCTRGRGLAVVDDVERDFAEGDLLILPPGITHRFINDSGKPWTYSGLFTPPSVESALRATGARKLPGAERPAAIPRNPATERMLVEKYGFIIPGLPQDQ